MEKVKEKIKKSGKQIVKHIFDKAVRCFYCEKLIKPGETAHVKLGERDAVLAYHSGCLTEEIAENQDLEKGKIPEEPWGMKLVSQCAGCGCDLEDNVDAVMDLNEDPDEYRRQKMMTPVSITCPECGHVNKL